MAWIRPRSGPKGLRHTGYYRDPAGRTRSAGTFPDERRALAAAIRAEGKVAEGTWFDRTAGRISFADYVETVWWPSLHLEITTLAGYRSYLDRHFLPHFGPMPMGDILPSPVQAWVTAALDSGLAPRSVVKYHVMLHGIFKQAARDRVIPHNPAADTRLPKVVTKSRRILTPEEFQTLLAKIPDRWLPLVLTDIETGLRWGELVALRPRHIDWQRRTITVSETIVEVSRKHSPTRERIIVKPYPKDNEPRVLSITDDLLTVLAGRIREYGLGRNDYLFPSVDGRGEHPVSKDTFRNRVWKPALEAAGLGFHVRMHDLRHAHASWLLAGGADLSAVMQRLGHRQITTTQNYLHTLPESDRRALDAFTRIRTHSTRPRDQSS
jgi:integrase